MDELTLRPDEGDASDMLAAMAGTGVSFPATTGYYGDPASPGSYAAQASCNGLTIALPESGTPPPPPPQAAASAPAAYGGGLGAGAADGGAGGVFAQLADESRLLNGLPVYRKVKLLGRGAFGKAYLVEAMKAPRSRFMPPSPAAGAAQKHRRVLKKIPLKGISEDQKEAAFREAQLMRKISRGSPFITQFSEVFLGKQGTILCLVMEFCSGGDLRSLLRHRKDEEGGAPFPEEQVLGWSSQIGLALRHCHVSGVLHRDVKPENCFFRSSGGDLLLGDFGISCSLDERSMAKTCVGSPLYLSPEIVNQERYSWATDVWSFGVMLYEMASLQPPFKGTNICQIAFKIVGAVPDPIDASYSEHLRTLVDRLLDKEPSTRMPLDQALVCLPLAPAAEAASLRHCLQWPPSSGLIATTASTSGLVHKLRTCTGLNAPMGAADSPEKLPGFADAPPPPPPPPPEQAEYEDDFEAYEEDFDPCSPPAACEEYDDDFEQASAGSNASYEEDFEELSDVEHDVTHEQFEEQLNEEVVRQQLAAELGAGGYAAADGRGHSVATFLEGLRASAAHPQQPVAC